MAEDDNTNVNGAQAVPVVAETAKLMNPVPMSFPQILRSSKLADRFAYLRDDPTLRHTNSAPAVSRGRTRDDREGKRWTRRKENCA